MNLSFRLINPQANRSYIFRRELFGMTTLWHYHPELELVYFIDDEDRVGRVSQYVYENFGSKITVAKAASIANMSETAFCRYFKSRTSKNFTRFINEVRVAHACKILQKSDAIVSDACFQSGFNSLSYFNRQFKAIMKMPPQKYKR